MRPARHALWYPQWAGGTAGAPQDRRTPSLAAGSQGRPCPLRGELPPSPSGCTAWLITGAGWGKARPPASVWGFPEGRPSQCRAPGTAGSCVLVPAGVGPQSPRPRLGVRFWEQPVPRAVLGLSGRRKGSDPGSVPTCLTQAEPRRRSPLPSALGLSQGRDQLPLAALREDWRPRDLEPVCDAVLRGQFQRSGAWPARQGRLLFRVRVRFWNEEAGPREPAGGPGARAAGPALAAGHGRL